jgi:hypothetical protein
MRIIGRPRALFAVLTSCLLLAGCGSGPSQVGAAVILGDRVVSVDDVQAKLDKLVQDNTFAKSLAQQHKLDLLSRSIVSREVLDRATAAAAQADGLRVDETAVAKRVQDLRAQQQGTQQPLATDAPEAGIQQATDAAFDLGELAHAQQIQAQLAAKYLPLLEVTFDGALLTAGDAKAKSQQLAARLAADPAHSADVVGTVSNTGGKAIPGLKLSLLGGLLLADQNGFELASSALFGARPNTAVAFPLSLQSTGQDASVNTAWFVGLVKTVDLNAKLTPQQAQMIQQIPDQVLIKVGERLVAGTVDQLNVKINPRYGVWDVVANGLAPRAEELAGYRYPPRAVQP